MVRRLAVVAGADIEQYAYRRICHSLSVRLSDTEVRVGDFAQRADAVGFLFGPCHRRLFRHAGYECCGNSFSGLFASGTVASVHTARYGRKFCTGCPHHGYFAFSEVSFVQCAGSSCCAAFHRILFVCPFGHAVAAHPVEQCAYSGVCHGGRRYTEKAVAVRWPDRTFTQLSIYPFVQ